MFKAPWLDKCSLQETWLERDFPIVWIRKRNLFLQVWPLCPRIPLSGQGMGSVQFSSVAQSCLTLCDGLDCHIWPYMPLAGSDAEALGKDAISPVLLLSPAFSLTSSMKHALREYLCRWVSDKYCCLPGNDCICHTLNEGRNQMKPL